MRWSWSAIFVVLLTQLGTQSSRGSELVPEVKARSSISVWDTGQASAEPLQPAALAGKNDWTAIPGDKTADAFKGDAVLSNGRIVAVFRKQDSAVEVYAVKPDRREWPGSAASDGRGRAGRSAGTDGLVENTKACLPGGIVQDREGDRGRRQGFASSAATFPCRRNRGPAPAKLRVECPGRLVVLPDFFADDITVDADPASPGQRRAAQRELCAAPDRQG